MECFRVPIFDLFDGNIVGASDCGARIARDNTVRCTVVTDGFRGSAGLGSFRAAKALSDGEFGTVDGGVEKVESFEC